jgi:antirestriction protein ArdC
MVKTSKQDEKFEIMTNRLIEIMEKGVLPWQKEWSSGNLYRNLTTGHVYQSTNTLICMVDCMTFGYQSPFFVTYNAAKERGWRVKKGATNLLKVRTKTIEKEEKGKTEKTLASFPVFNWFQVFNIDLIDDSESEVKIADLALKYEQPVTSEKERHEKAEMIIAAQKANIMYGHSKAAYSPQMDAIVMPHLAQFTTPEAYYSTSFHELVHRTGHKSRLDRVLNTNSSSAEYAREELIAELGASYVCQEVGITSSLENHASYLDHWVSHLKSDNSKKLIFNASAAAMKAANYILENAGIVKVQATTE